MTTSHHRDRRLRVLCHLGLFGSLIASSAAWGDGELPSEDTVGPETLAGSWLGGEAYDDSQDFLIEFTGTTATFEDIRGQLSEFAMAGTLTFDGSPHITGQAERTEDAEGHIFHLLMQSANRAVLWFDGDEDLYVIRRLAPVPEALIGAWEVRPGGARDGFSLQIDEEQMIARSLGGGSQTAREEVLRLFAVASDANSHLLAAGPVGRRPDLIEFIPIGEGFITQEIGRSSYDFVFRPGTTPSWVPAPTYFQEATLNVRRLYDSAILYFEVGQVDAAGNALAQHFPASAPLTPSEIPCGVAAEPLPEDWAASPSWATLNFEVREPHRYSYQFDSEGTGVGATFTASAFGDVDCDGIYSTFIRVGEVTSENEVRGHYDLLDTNPTE